MSARKPTMFEVSDTAIAWCWKLSDGSRGITVTDREYGHEMDGGVFTPTASEAKRLSKWLHKAALWVADGG